MEGKVLQRILPRLFFRSVNICTLMNDRLIYRFLPLLLYNLFFSLSSPFLAPISRGKYVSLPQWGWLIE